MGNGIATLGELHGVTLAKIKENAQKVAAKTATLEELMEKKEEEKIVPELRTRNINLDKIRQQADQVRNFVTTVAEFMDESFSKLAAIQTMPEEERELAEDIERNLREQIENTLNVGVASAKKAALVAYALAKAKYCIATKERALILLDDLEKRGIIVKISARDNTTILAWDNKYVVTPSLRQPTRDIEKALIGLISRTRALDQQKFEENKKALVKKTGVDTSIRELFDGKTGRAGFDVRPMRVNTNLQNEHEEEDIPGGFVVVENDGNQITPVAGLGDITPLINELRKKRTSISVQMVWRSYFTPIKIKDPDIFRRLIILHRLLKNGLELANRQRSRS